MPEALCLPFLWDGDEIEAREDGFLLLKNHHDGEEQPMLLQSAETLLQTLYPNTARQSIFSNVGYMEEDLPEGTSSEPAETELGSSSTENPEAENDDEGTPSSKGGKNKKKAPKILPQYIVYQTLIRENTIAARIQSALLDIRYNRHRKRKPEVGRADWSYGGARIRALEHQQERLASCRAANSSMTPAAADTNTGDSMIQTNESDDENDDDEQSPDENEEDDEEIFEREPSPVRLVRTLNSIRALFPHLLPILLHRRLSDRDLVIGTARWKRRSRGQMCWLLGTKVFDTTTNKVATGALSSMKEIMQSFLDADEAIRISNDPLGAPDFWSSSWISQFLLKGTRPVARPLSILTDLRMDVEGTKDKCRDYDERFLSRESGAPDIQRQYLDVIDRVHRRIEKLLNNRFPGSRLSIYGSCLSDLSLGHASDIDLSLWLPEAERLKKGFQDGTIEASKYEKDTKKIVYQACRKLENYQHEFRNMQPIVRARVPVLKGTYLKAGNPHSEDGNINFDICFLNDIAVANSSLIREYSLVDVRGKALMLAVKRWAKEFNINSAKDNTISSYTWINLVIFYLQCLGFFPNLQDRKLMEMAGLTPDPIGNIWHNVNDLDTCFLKWSQVKSTNVWERPAELDDVSVSELLYGFFEFYNRRFPSAIYAVSIKRGNISLPRMECRKNSLFICIEDPFETFDSYCPHDLGSHATEVGVKDISQYLKDAEEHLRELLLGAPLEGSLWPTPPFLDPQPPRRNKNAQFRRFEQGEGKQDHNKGGGAHTGKIEPDPTSRRKPRNPRNQGRRGGQGRGKQGPNRGPHQQGTNIESQTRKDRNVPEKIAGTRNGEKGGTQQASPGDRQQSTSQQRNRKTQHAGRNTGKKSNRRRKPHPSGDNRAKASANGDVAKGS